MKWMNLLASVSLSVCPILWSVAGEQPIVTNNLTFSKAQQDPYLGELVRHVSWPSDSDVKSKQYDVRKLRTDIADFSNNLARILRDDYLPGGGQIRSGIVGVTNLYWDDDYLLLQYTTRSGSRVCVQDGKGLYIMIEPSDNSRRSVADLDWFVKQVATNSLRYPVETGNLVDRMKVSTFPVDIENTRCGILFLTQPLRLQEWHDNVHWWADGKKVLFGISKVAVEKRAVTAQYVPPPPRRFHARQQEQGNPPPK